MYHFLCRLHRQGRRHRGRASPSRRRPSAPASARRSCRCSRPSTRSMLGEAHRRATTCSTWLVNTGWTGGPTASASACRSPPPARWCAPRSAASSTRRPRASTPCSASRCRSPCPASTPSCSTRARTWADPRLRRHAAKLAGEFSAHFAVFAGDVSPEVAAARTEQQLLKRLEPRAGVRQDLASPPNGRRSGTARGDAPRAVMNEFLPGEWAQKSAPLRHDSVSARRCSSRPRGDHPPLEDGGSTPLLASSSERPMPPSHADPWTRPQTWLVRRERSMPWPTVSPSLTCQQNGRKDGLSSPDGRFVWRLPRRSSSPPECP